MDEMPEIKLYGCTYKVNKSMKELPTVLCVNSEGGTAFNVGGKGCDPTVAPDVSNQWFSFKSDHIVTDEVALSMRLWR